MASCGDDKAMAAKKLNLDNFRPYRLSIASNVLLSRIAAEYENRFGLKIPEWRLMAVLGEGQPKTQRELVAATRMDKVTVNRADRKSVVEGKSVSVRVDLGGRRIIKKKTDIQERMTNIEAIKAK